jgi:RimJ/RimL family protein N-acetyltransferase
MTSSLPADTQRLRFRPLVMDDVDELVALHEDPLIVRFLGSRDRAWLERFIGIVDEEWAERGHGRVAVVERESGRFIGRTGLRYWQQFGETEVSWVLHADARGKGYATEAGTAVAERLGMSPIRSDRLLGEDVTVYALTRVAFVDP